MGPKTKELVDTLQKIIELLQEDGETHWGNWVNKAKTRIQQSDFSGIEYLLSAYGGMGSFNDLVIGQTQMNGKWAWKPNYQQKNDALNRLRGSAYQLAEHIKQNYEISKT